MQIRNEKRLQTSDESETVRFEKSPVQGINQSKNEILLTNDSANLQESKHKYNTTQIQISDGFVCARKVHENNARLSKPGTSSSKSKTRKSKTDKNVKKADKSVYEQILASARSSLRSTNESSNISPETESKAIDIIAETVKNEEQIIEGKGKNKRSRESIERLEDDVKPIEKKRIEYREYNKNDNFLSNRNINEKITCDKIDTKAIKNDVHTISNMDVARRDPLITKESKIQIRQHSQTSKTNLELKKDKKAQSVHSKHHSSKSSNKPKVPADKVMQFKTAEILKSYLMRYYPSERLPDRATFSKTCREMHYNMLRKKIFGETIS